MKITNRKNFKGQTLAEWTLKEEHAEYYILEKDGHSLTYPKANFESEKEHAGASRDGDKFFIPVKSK